MGLDITRYSDIYIETLDKWGEKAQFDQAIEECAELILTLQHYTRGKVDQDTVVNEIADVYLMVGQLAFMFGESRLSDAIDSKIEKLQGLLELE
jgi:NTP pyrophosphatase (non-canonical NTP hydrolase)